MSYLDRLKRLENGEIFHHTPEHEPAKPPKAPFAGFAGSVPVPNENIHAQNTTRVTANEEGLIFKKCARPLPAKPAKGTEHRHWLVQFPDRDALEVFCHPNASHAEVMLRYPDATLAEPIPEPPQPVLSPSGKWYFTPPNPTN